MASSSISLVDLFRYKKEVEIRDPKTDKVLTKVWIRVLGDLDLTKAYKHARVASAEKRAALRDPSTDDYKDEVFGLKDIPLEDQKEIIRTAYMQNIVADASLAVERPDAPELPEVAVEPDAARLEELEKFDKLEDDVDEKYQNDIDEYIKNRTEELNAMLEAKSAEEILQMAQEEISNLLPFSVFLSELNLLKVFYGTFRDKDCTIPAFSDLDDVKQLPKSIQEHLIAQISELEIGGDQIKN